MGVWLVWLCVCLPASAFLFLGVPALLALFGVGMLERADVPLEVWSELEPWLGLLLLTGIIHGHASFAHRRAPRRDDSLVSGRWWWVLGGVAGAAWLGLWRLEIDPRTNINPVLHYWALSGVIVWTSSSLAWLSGRATSLVIGPVEQLSLRSEAVRGSLVTAGPLSLVGVMALGGTTVGLDASEAVDDARALVADNFKDDWSVPALGPAPPAQSAALPTTGSSRLERGAWFRECIENIYEQRQGRVSLFQEAVRSISSFHGVDVESVAADTAIKVCSHPKRPESLRPYYLRSVRNRAKTSDARSMRFECELRFLDDRAHADTPEVDDCIRRQLCALGEDDQDVLLNLLEGKTTREFARQRNLTQSAAEKRLSRAKLRLDGALRRECFD